MTQIDQFESIFRSATVEAYEHQDWPIQKVMIVCDGNQETAEQFGKRIRDFLSESVAVDEIDWVFAPGDQFDSVQQLVDLVNQHQPQLICSHRNLHVDHSDFPYSLGSYIDVLAQVAPAPLLLLPDPESNAQLPSTAKQVMALTDHLDDDLAIVHSAIKLTAHNGTLFLTHIEDQHAYDRIIHVIEKIAEIDSDIAREKIAARLLLEPARFIESCKTEVEAQEIPLTVEAIVQMGNNLSEYKRLVTEHDIDLVVMHTKDDDQLAMHGLAYPLTIELREVPLLLI